MGDTAYSYHLRTVECDRCGAPLTGSPQGGTVTCGFCGSLLQLAGRSHEQPQQTRIDEPSRLAGLRALQASFDSSAAMIRTPDGMEPFANMLADPSTKAAGLEGFRQEWEKTRAALQASQGRSVQTETRLFQLALFIAQQYRDAGVHPRARAVLETALGLLSDADQRGIVRCRLARAAVRAGDFQAAGAWLSEVNPRPIALEPDGEYRLARAALGVAQGDYAGALGALGRSAADVPHRETILAACLRAHALAGIGDIEAAKAEVEAATSRFGREAVEREWRDRPGPSSSFAAAVAETTTRRASRSAWLSSTALGLFAIAFILGNCGTPMCLATTTCGRSGLYQLTLDRLNECPQARELLGDDITWAMGCSGCTGEGSQGCKDGCGLDWYMAVQGSKGRGTVEISSTDWNGHRHLMGKLTTSRGTLDLATCNPK
ncbi:MAG: hypothetical protein HY898_16940 [Deltaproteobacteria bacterium]|nr:hypothetical protein [Deltaproteobacteria bacterium]